jgi:hypothetical protein
MIFQVPYKEPLWVTRGLTLAAVMYVPVQHIHML